ncbi:hypothetical protein [Caballeronia sp. LZ035]|uniref:hypothetical protein n=1 Tax=Caballeronia sp. LZ035 TaxID=3038568 RepID=UPI00286411F5|nr:hypothetical protein [Caballeronia sp. LZ035]MDR5760432.1 hypothetical protein [Caballeronia sp. LZ035]
MPLDNLTSSISVCAPLDKPFGGISVCAPLDKPIISISVSAPLDNLTRSITVRMPLNKATRSILVCLYVTNLLPSTPMLLSPIFYSLDNLSRNALTFIVEQTRVVLVKSGLSDFTGVGSYSVGIIIFARLCLTCFHKAQNAQSTRRFPEPTPVLNPTHHQALFSESS